LKEAKKEIKKARKEASQQRVRIIAADVAKGEALIKTVRDHIEKHGAFDCLITSAGATGPQYFEDIPLEDFERLMQINYLGTVASVKAVVPSMCIFIFCLFAHVLICFNRKSKKNGKIVFISSLAGQIGIFGKRHTLSITLLAHYLLLSTEGYSSYSPTKFALRGLAGIYY